MSSLLDLRLGLHSPALSWVPLPWCRSPSKLQQLGRPGCTAPVPTAHAAAHFACLARLPHRSRTPPPARPRRSSPWLPGRSDTSLWALPTATCATLRCLCSTWRAEGEAPARRPQQWQAARAGVESRGSSCCRYARARGAPWGTACGIPLACQCNAPVEILPAQRARQQRASLPCSFASQEILEELAARNAMSSKVRPWGLGQGGGRACLEI